MSLLLRFFGYSKVPPEAVGLVCQARLMWEKNPANYRIGIALHALEKLLRSTQ